MLEEALVLARVNRVDLFQVSIRVDFTTTQVSALNLAQLDDLRGVDGKRIGRQHAKVCQFTLFQAAQVLGTTNVFGGIDRVRAESIVERDGLIGSVDVAREATAGGHGLDVEERDGRGDGAVVVERDAGTAGKGRAGLDPLRAYFAGEHDSVEQVTLLKSIIKIKKERKFSKNI